MATRKPGDPGDGDGRRPKLRGITEDADRRLRVLQRVFRHKGRPSFDSHRRAAKDLGLSSQAVSACVKKGHENGEFVVIFPDPRERHEVARLEEAVLRRYERFGLREVLLVPGDLEILADIDLARRRALRTEIMQLIALRVADYLDDRVAEAVARGRAAVAGGEKAETFIIGVAWGRTLHLVAQALQSKPRPCHLADLLVVPIVAPTAAFRQDPVEANLIAMAIARAYGGRSGQLLCPAFVTKEQAKLLRDLPDVRRMQATIRQVDLAITSLGPISANPSASDVRVSNDPETNRKILEEASKTRAIGDICGVLFGPDGKQVEMSIETMGLGFGLREVARDPDRGTVLAIASDLDRLEPVQVAIEAGFASVLITDTVTARYLVGELDVELPRRAG